MVNVIAESDPEASPRVAVFETALRKLGWTERDLRIDYHWGASDVARGRALAKELVATRPDLIMTVTTPPTQAVRDETRDIPVVFLQVFDPVSTGLVASLARPGGNITGFTNFEPSMASKWLQLLKEIAPRVKHVALLFNPTTTIGSQLYIDSIEAASTSFAVEPATVHVRSVEDVSEALLKLASDPDAGLIVVPDTFTTNNRDLITSLAARHRVPAIYPFQYFATVGGLLSDGIDATDLFHRSASYVDVILKGAKPADLPVQQPTKFELVINLKTARSVVKSSQPLVI